MLTTISLIIVRLASILGVCPRLGSAGHTRTVGSRPTAVPAIATFESIDPSRASTVGKEIRRCQRWKGTLDQRPNRAARIRRAGNLTRTRKESKAKREAGASQRARALSIRFFQSIECLYQPIEFAVDGLDVSLEDTRPRVDHQKAITNRERQPDLRQGLVEYVTDRLLLEFCRNDEIELHFASRSPSGLT